MDLQNRYVITSNRESGGDRYDVVLQRNKAWRKLLSKKIYIDQKNAAFFEKSKMRIKIGRECKRIAKWSIGHVSAEMIQNISTVLL